VLGGLAAGALVRRDGTGNPPPSGAEDDRRAELERQLQEMRAKLEEERAQLTLGRKRLEFDRLLSRGEAAMARQRFEDAQQAYREALQLFPEDTKALAGLTEAKTSLQAAANTAAREKEERDKRQAEVQRLTGQAKEAMSKKQYADAVRALEGARQLAPGDEAVNKALAEAQAALDKDAAEQKRLAEYKTHMDAARAALEAQRFTEAVREALAAQQAIPADGDAVLLQKEAENRLAALQNFEKRVAAHKDLVDRAAAAMASRHYADAVALYTTAQKLFPDDKNVQKALKAARVARVQAREEYDRLIALADIAARTNRLEEAHRLYKQAAETMPGEPAAERGLQATAGVIDNVRAGRAAYGRFMTQGIDALRAQRFLEASRAFREALRLLPGDPDATAGLRDAERALAQPGRIQVEFAKLMQTGADALRQRQYADAIRAFSDAVQLAPDNADAAAGLHKAKYGQAMSKGQEALLARKIPEAIDAFKKALEEMPGDPAATAALRQARALDK
jgi:tetratricopeptide (TPR) repeat protein